VNDNASKSRSPETRFTGQKFFAEETSFHEKEMHPNDVIRMLKDELRRTNEHIYELYQWIAELSEREKQ